MIPPEDQEREGAESADAMGALETLLLAMAGARLLALSSSAPKVVNKAAADLRREAAKAAADGMGAVDDAVSRDLAGRLVLSAVTELSHAEEGAGKARAAQKAMDGARKEARRAASEARKETRKMAACMVDDLNAKFLREAARARAMATGDSKRGIAAVNHRDAMREAVVRLAEEGLTAYTYKRKDGAVVHVPVDVGIRRAVDNAGKQRQIEQTLAMAEATGSNMVEVSITAGARKSHEEWQGRRYLLRGSSDKYPNFYKACRKGDDVDGIGGYNCRHQIAVCREGDPPRFRDPLEGTGYTQEEARKALTKQRRMENDLRRMKRQREVMRKNGIPTKEMDAEIKALDKAIDGHVAKHSKVLRRDRHRESIYERARKAAKAEGVVWLDEGQQRAVRKASGAKIASEPGKLKGDEVSRRTKKVDITFIESDDYRKAFDFFGDRAIGDLACSESRKMLKHRTGTTLEDFSAISISGKTVVTRLTSSKVSKTAVLTRENVRALLDAKRGDVVTIHNHPENMPPSFQDFRLLTVRSIRYGIIACHNGSVVRYRIADRELFGSVVASGRGGEVDSFLARHMVYYGTESGDAVISKELERRFGVTYERLY